MTSTCVSEVNLSDEATIRELADFAMEHAPLTEDDMGLVIKDLRNHQAAGIIFEAVMNGEVAVNVEDGKVGYRKLIDHSKDGI